jgi:hypothetical protein
VTDRHGLPETLDDWLFPSDGSTRHFPTLQVVLSGEESFWASDKDGQIRNAIPESARELQREKTPGHAPPIESLPQRRWSTVRELARDPERRRSLTWSSARRGKGDLAATGLVQDARSASTDAAMTRLKRRSTWMIARTPNVGELEVLKELGSPRLPQTPRPTSYSRDATPRSRCSCNCHEKATKAKNSTEAAYQYTDAAVQTGGPWNQRYSTASTLVCNSPDEEYPTQEQLSCTQRWLTLKERKDDESRYTELYEKARHHRQVSSVNHGPPTLIASPVVMGRMQDYFRAATYKLGDALGPR